MFWATVAHHPNQQQETPDCRRRAGDIESDGLKAAGRERQPGRVRRDGRRLGMRLRLLACALRERRESVRGVLIEESGDLDILFALKIPDRLPCCLAENAADRRAARDVAVLQQRLLQAHILARLAVGFLIRSAVEGSPY